MRWGVCLLLLSLPGAASSGQTGRGAAVEIVTSERSAPTVLFGADEIQAALAQSGFQVRRTHTRSSGGTRVIVAVQGDPLLGGVGPEDPQSPSSPESYAISTAKDTVVVAGGDGTGAMYGAIDVAEQIRSAADGDLSARVKPARKSPFLAIRGINTFLTAQGFDEPDSWYWSDDFWRRFLDMMARTRHNFLDLHGPFDITVSFTNGFPYFVYLPDFPDVGVGPERAARNLKRFRQIIKMASERGVRVGFMNYTAAATIGPWKTGRFWKDERYAPRPQAYLPAARLEEYTRKAVAMFLREVPELWMFGFRVGESGQPEDFYRKTYIEALKTAPRDLAVYARTWIADPQRVREIADLTGHKFFIEPKYNGEHLGLPYPAVTGGRYYPPSGSWEDYTNYPKNYSVIWQIRANGTHRVFHWGWPEFARRTMRSCRFAGGEGFSMEPMNSYYPQRDYVHNNPETPHKFAEWVFEQQWFWYLLWGRTGYDPDVPERVWLAEFERRFGTEAGRSTYNALVESSKIVPFVYSYHNQGLDHQHMAPEFETGDHALSARNTIWQGSRLVPFGGGLEEFLNTPALDRTAMADPRSYAEMALKNVPTGKMTPFVAAAYLDAAAAASRDYTAAAERLNPRDKTEFECIRLDVEAVSELGRYYADHIRSAAHLALYRQTWHHPELTLGHEYMARAAEHWDRLSDTTERHFGYVPELIRMRVYKFRWRDEGRSLGIALEDINRMEEEFQRLPHRRLALIGHVPPHKIPPGKAVTLVATLASGPADARLHLFYRNSPEIGFEHVAMRPLNEFERTWAAEISAGSVAPGRLEYYFEAYEGISGAYGGTLEQRPPYAVPVNSDDTPPAISHATPPAGIRGKSVKLTATVRSHSDVSIVRLWYKRMPAYHEWVGIEMRPEKDGQYSVSVPLTPEGILYYFEASDLNGNAANYPYFLEQTPYFAVEGWDPRESR